MTKIALPTDLHVPYHDPRALSVAHKIINDFDPDYILAGSDGVDFYAISKFDHDPARMKFYGLQKEIDTWRSIQKEFRDAAPRAAVLYLPGNHEERLRKYVWRHPELYGLEALRLEKLLGFESLGINWDGSTEYMIDDQLMLVHGEIARKYSGYSAKGELEKIHYSYSLWMGHTHRGGIHYAQTRRGMVFAAEGFCLCNLEPEYVRHPDWQHGIVLATITKNGIELDPIAFDSKRRKVTAVWRDKYYQS